MKDEVVKILLVEDDVNDRGVTLDVFERNHMAMLLGYESGAAIRWRCSKGNRTRRVRQRYARELRRSTK
jgi:hypothetical protein